MEHNRAVHSSKSASPQEIAWHSLDSVALLELHAAPVISTTTRPSSLSSLCVTHQAAVKLQLAIAVLLTSTHTVRMQSAAARSAQLTHSAAIPNGISSVSMQRWSSAKCAAQALHQQTTSALAQSRFSMASPLSTPRLQRAFSSPHALSSVATSTTTSGTPMSQLKQAHSPCPPATLRATTPRLRSSAVIVHRSSTSHAMMTVLVAQPSLRR